MISLFYHTIDANIGSSNQTEAKITLCLSNKTAPETSTSALPPQNHIDEETNNNVIEASNQLCQTEEEATLMSDRVDDEDDDAEFTYLHIKTYVVFDEVSPSKLADKTIGDLVTPDILPAICRYTSVQLKGTSRLVSLIQRYVRTILAEMKTAKRAGGQSGRNFRAKMNERTWRCRVFADEFVKRKDFERIAGEEKQYQADLEEIKNMDANDKESALEESVEGIGDEVVNFKVTKLVVDLSLLMKEVKNINSKKKSASFSSVLPENDIQDIFKVVCQSKALELVYSTRLQHNFRTYIRRMVMRLAKKASVGGSQARRVAEKLHEQKWHMKVHADEFVKVEDFRRACVEWDRHEVETHAVRAQERIAKQQKIKEKQKAKGKQTRDDDVMIKEEEEMKMAKEMMLECDVPNKDNVSERYLPSSGNPKSMLSAIKLNIQVIHRYSHSNSQCYQQ